MTGSRWEPANPIRLRVSVVVMLALVISMLSGEVAWAAAPWASPAELMASPGLPKRPAQTPRVRSVPVTGTPVQVGTRPGHGRSRVTWPVRGSGKISAGGRGTVAGLGVGVRGTSRDMRVSVLDRAASQRAGVTGVVFGMQDDDSATSQSAKGPVTISVDVSQFADAIGGDWVSRARLVEVPDCDVASPEAGCAVTAEPLQGSTSDGSTVSGVLPAATASKLSSGMVALALTADASGAAGSFTATSLSPSAAWSAGSGTGGFSWQYPIDVPDTGAGPSPEVTVSYSSASLDGRTASTNNQASWVGDGFDLNLGFVERRYVSCADDMAAQNGQAANNANRKTGDLCWGPDSVTMSLAGHSTDLVHDTATGAWIPKDDDNTRVQLLTGESNGDNNGEYWLVTTDDGTKYYFGRQSRGAGDTATLNSTQTAPVYGNHPGEQCYAATFSTAWCQQAYRWNLAYVVDVNGNAMSLFYDKETNYYNRNMGSTANTGTGFGTTQITPYDRGAVLNRVEYGTRDGVWTGKAPYQVTFATAERCIPTGSFT